MDVYDQEIARLADSTRQALHESWGKCGPLFQFANQTGKAGNNRSCDCRCGCLTMVRGRASAGGHAWTDGLTLEIQNDARIPESHFDMENKWNSISAEERIAILQPFAEWQRRLDVEIRGKSPVESAVTV